MAGDAGSNEDRMAARAKHVARCVPGGGRAGEIRTDRASVCEGRAGGGSVRAGRWSSGSMKGVGTDLHDGTDLGPRHGGGVPHVVIVLG